MSAIQDPELWFHELATRYVEVQILYHLNQAGVFRLLDAEGPLDAETIARRLELEPRVLASLLDYVAAVDELLSRDEAGRYGFREFGRRVLERYGRREGSQAHFNFFDVRAGAYAPVWGNLDRLLRGAVYGRDVRRAGEIAADAVYKLVVRLEPKLREVIAQTRAQAVVELGVSTGLLERLGAADPKLELYGVDRSRETLAKAAARAEAAGVSRVRWLEGDVFRPEAWMRELGGTGPGVIFSVHFHEFLAPPRTADDMARALGKLCEHLPGWSVVAFEQPLLPDSARAELTPSQWLYAHSNVLIHHLIGNGRILPEQAWQDMLVRSGCQVEAATPVNYLGYLAFVGSFPVVLEK